MCSYYRFSNGIFFSISYADFRDKSAKHPHDLWEELLAADGSVFLSSRVERQLLFVRFRTL